MESWRGRLSVDTVFVMGVVSLEGLQLPLSFQSREYAADTADTALSAISLQIQSHS